MPPPTKPPQKYSQYLGALGKIRAKKPKKPKKPNKPKLQKNSINFSKIILKRAEEAKAAEAGDGTEAEDAKALDEEYNVEGFAQDLILKAKDTAESLTVFEDDAAAAGDGAKPSAAGPEAVEAEGVGADAKELADAVHEADPADGEAAGALAAAPTLRDTNADAAAEVVPNPGDGAEPAEEPAAEVPPEAPHEAQPAAASQPDHSHPRDAAAAAKALAAAVDEDDDAKVVAKPGPETPKFQTSAKLADEDLKAGNTGADAAEEAKPDAEALDAATATKAKLEKS